MTRSIRHWNGQLEKIAELTVDQVKALRENAAKRKAQETVDLCDADLGRRKALRGKRTKTFNQTHIGEAFNGFHFVCPDEKGITRNSDGTVWTGTWVVNSTHADCAVKIGVMWLCMWRNPNRRTCKVP